MFGFFKPRTPIASPITTLTPTDVHSLMSSTSVALVDAREPSEFRAERIAGAINIPLSQLETQADRIPTDRPVILHCLSGRRSKSALELCTRFGLPVDTHMSGGISAWKAAGLPVQR
jgi:phage shock protein E